MSALEDELKLIQDAGAVVMKRRETRDDTHVPDAVVRPVALTYLGLKLEELIVELRRIANALEGSSAHRAPEPSE